MAQTVTSTYAQQGCAMLGYGAMIVQMALYIVVFPDVVGTENANYAMRFLGGSLFIEVIFTTNMRLPSAGEDPGITRLRSALAAISGVGLVGIFLTSLVYACMALDVFWYDANATTKTFFVFAFWVRVLSIAVRIVWGVTFGIVYRSHIFGVGGQVDAAASLVAIPLGSGSSSSSSSSSSGQPALAAKYGVSKGKPNMFAALREPSEL